MWIEVDGVRVYVPREVEAAGGEAMAAHVARVLATQVPPSVAAEGPTEAETTKPARKRVSQRVTTTEEV